MTHYKLYKSSIVCDLGEFKKEQNYFAMLLDIRIRYKWQIYICFQDKNMLFHASFYQMCYLICL